MIVVIFKWFEDEKTREREFLADYALDADTLEAHVVPDLSPSRMGARFDKSLGEWVID